MGEEGEGGGEGVEDEVEGGREMVEETEIMMEIIKEYLESLLKNFSLKELIMNLRKMI